MNPSHPSSRKTREVRLVAEALESRSLLTTGAGNSFAIIPGTVNKIGDVTAVKFTIDPTHFHLPQGKITLGIDVAPDPTSALKPSIAAVKDARGVPLAVSHAAYSPKVLSSQPGLSKMTTAVESTVRLNPKAPTAPVTYEVDVRGQAATTGKFLLGFYLPGDANGDGTVNATDVTAVKSALGANAGDKTYNFDADANRDGRINGADLQAALKNQGVTTDVTPIVAANLDSTGLVDVNERVTRTPSAHFTGTMTPMGSVTYSETGGKVQPVSAAADAKGNYSLTVPLGEGQNTFKVTTLDAFGQSISGTLAAVTYSTNPAVSSSTAAQMTQSTGTPAVAVKKA